MITEIVALGSIVGSLWLITVYLESQQTTEPIPFSATDIPGIDTEDKNGGDEQ